MKKLTPEAFDSLTRVHVREDRIIWTAAAIGGRIGRSEDYVRKVLAFEAGTPILRKNNRLYVFEAALLEFMKSRGR